MKQNLKERKLNTCDRRLHTKRPLIWKLASTVMVTGSVVVVPSLITQENHLGLINLFSDRLAVAQTTLPNNISTQMDTSPTGDAGRTVSYNAQDIKNSTVLLKTNGTADQWVTNTDPLGNQYLQLVGDGSQQFGYGILKKQISATSDFKINGFFNPTNLVSQGNSSSGDWLGIMMIPTDPNQFTVSPDGGALGIANTPNALALGIDMFRNNNYNDPSDGPFAAVRWTDGSGKLNGFANWNNLYTSSQNLTQWGKTMSYEFYYHYNNGVPYITGNIIVYGNGNQQFSFDTRNPGGGSAPITITPPTSGFYTVGLNGANGTNHQSMRANMTVGQMTLYAASATIKYQIDGSGATVAPSTTLKSATRDVIGITGVTSGALANTDDYTFDGSVPATADPKYKTGYHLKRALSQADGKDDLTFLTDSTQNVYTLFYTPDYQQANVKTDGTDPKGPQTIDSISGTSGSSMTGWMKKDADLARSGYTYKVTGPDGKIYNTLAAAQASVTSFDSTSNGSSSTDSAPQNFTVTYTRIYQQAIVKSILNGDASTLSTVASYDITSTPDKPLENGTSGNLMSNVTDTALTRPNYTYTVTGPDGKIYSTMQEAWQANNVWDTTANPPGETSDSNPQVWIVNYTGTTQTATLDQTSTDGKGPTGNKSTLNGASGSKIDFGVSDKDLQTPGYNYVVKVFDGFGNLIGTYNSLADAIVANPTFDSNNTSTDPNIDKNPQKFQVEYTPLDEEVTSHYVDNKGNIIQNPTTSQQKTNSDIDTSNPPIVPGYVFVQVDPSSDKIVKADGSSQVTYVYQIDPAIIQAANDAETNAKNSNVKNEPSVQQAETNLQNILSDPKSTPQQIQDATNALNNAVSQAQKDRQTATDNANSAVVNADKSPVANEPSVQSTENNLKSVLADPNATTQQIVDATNALNNAVAQATTNRNMATDNANNAVAVADNSSVSKDPSVQSAENNLKSVLADPNATTQQITDATNSLNNAVSSATSDKNQATTDANTALGKTAPVSNEAAVKQAVTDLKNTLNDPNSTAQQIKDATSALNNAVSSANTDRNTANNNANTAVINANNSTAANDLNVQNAIKNLQQIQQAAASDSANDLTQNIIDATNALNQAVATATADQSQARKDAATALDNTKPVSNEANVKQAVTNLNNILADPNASASDIESATNALTSATQSANNSRNSAVNSANTEIKQAQNDPVDSQDPNVADAIAHLQDVMNKASQDDPNNLTQDIIDATKALNTAMSSSNQQHTDAVNNANNLLQKTAPVSNEPNVAQAISNLNNVLNNPSHSTQDIVSATNALQSVLDSANSDRNNANTMANTAITNANNSSVANEKTVQDAITALKNAQSEAAADSPNDLTQDIQSLTNALNQAVADATTSRLAAQKAGQDAIDNAKPVSHEPSTAELISQLQNAMADPTTTTDQLTALANSLNIDVSSEKAQRNQTITDGNTVISNAQSSPVSNEKTVQDAITNLNNVIANSKTDDPNALTKDIQAAIAALKTAQTQAQADRDAATNNANSAIKNADNSPVHNEPTVQNAENNLKNILADPNSTTQQITDATNALDDAVTQATTDRQTATNNANNAIKNADGSTAVNDPNVQNAENNLKNVLNDPNSTTQQITDATNSLNDVVKQATQSRQDAINDANKAMDPAKTSPVSNEPAVAQMITNLKDVVNDPNSTVKQIQDATTALDNAVQAATTDRSNAINDANTVANNASQSPVGQEPSVVSAINNLNNVIANSKTDDPSALTKDIQAAMKAVQDAQKAAQDVRDAANQSIQNADNSPVANEPSVQNAEKNLQDVLNNPTSTTQQITDATNALDDVVTQATTDRNDATNDAHQAISNANNSLIANEPSVQNAEKSLQDVLNNPTSTTDDIKKATDALNNTVTQATTDRNNATNDADNAIKSADGSPVANEPSVQNAENNLKNALNSSNSTTDDIKKATDALNNSVSQATTDKQNAVDNANKAMDPAKTSPVSHESDVAQAITDLKNLLNDPKSTAQQITDATNTLNTRVSQEYQRRNDAINDANSFMNTVDQSPYANIPVVKNAEDKLKQVIADSKNDDPAALTQNIKDALFALQTAYFTVNEAQKSIDNANSSPVANEPSVQNAENNLKNVMNIPSSTPEDVKKATDALNDAVQKATTDRDNAVKNANNALNNSKNNPAVSGDPSVQKAQENLNNVLNDPKSTTDDIKKSTDDLNNVVKNVQQTDETERERAISNALAEIGKTAPVSHESKVAQDITDLKKLISNPNSTADQINQATDRLKRDFQDASTARNKTEDAANNLINIVKNSPVGQEPSVAEAIKHLQDIMKNADNDNPNALTKDIQDAINKLQAVQKAAEDVRQSANNEIDHVGPVKNNPAVRDAFDRLRNLLNNPKSSIEDINAAISQLNEAINRAKQPALTSFENATKKILPKTGSDENSLLSDIGIVLLSLLTFSWLGKRKNDNSDNNDNPTIH